jgi:hypothetical protein
MREMKNIMDVHSWIVHWLVRWTTLQGPVHVMTTAFVVSRHVGTKHHEAASKIYTSFSDVLIAGLLMK